MTAQPTNGDDARSARLRAEKKLEIQRAKTGTIDRIADAMAKFAEENNFAHRIGKLFRETT